MARDVRKDLEAALSGVASMAQGTAEGFLTAGRYVNDAMYDRESADWSDAQEWAQRTIAPIAHTPSRETQETQREIFQSVADPIKSGYDAGMLGLKTMAATGAAKALGGKVADIWGSIPEDTKVALDSLSTVAEPFLNFVGAGFVPAMIKKGQRIQGFHGTHANIDAGFDPNMVDLGVHVGTPQQAENRLKDLFNERNFRSSWRGSAGFEPGANVMPVEFDTGRMLEMEDIGTWNDSTRVAEELNNIPGNEGRFDDLLAEAEDIKRTFEDNMDWVDSPENRELLDELGDSLREDYDTIRYRNQVENTYSDMAEFTPQAQARMDELNTEYNQIQQTIAGRKKPPTIKEVEAAGGDQDKINKLFDDFYSNEPKPTKAERKRLDQINAENVALMEDPANLVDQNSYIILDPEKAESPFDPATTRRKGYYLESADKPNTFRMPGQEDVIRTSNIDFRNPLVANLDRGDKKPAKWEVELAEAFDDQAIDTLALKAEGHDGVVIKRPGAQVDFMATSPGQINTRRMDIAQQDALDQANAQFAIDMGAASPIDVGARRAFDRPSVPSSKKNNPYWHPASKSRMKTPYEDLEATLIDTPGVKLDELEVISPEDQIGEWSVGSSWDRSKRGKTVTHVNGMELDNPVPLEGGFEYINDPTVGAGASGQSVVSALMNSARTTGEDVVNIIPHALGHQGANFSTMVTDVHLGRKKHYPVSDEAVEAFDADMRSNKKGKNWPGYNSPDLQEALDNDPAMRTWFLDRMQLAKHKAEGFPDVESSIKAVTNPDMEDMPDLFGGRAIGRIDTTADIRDVPGGHKSYDWDLPNKGPGVGYDRDYPARLQFMDWGATRELTGSGVGGDARSFQMSYPVQEMTPELAQVLAIHPGYRGMPGGRR